MAQRAVVPFHVDVVVHAHVVTRGLHVVALRADDGLRRLETVAQVVDQLQLGGRGVRVAGRAGEDVAGRRRNLVVQRLQLVRGDGAVSGGARKAHVHHAVLHGLVVVAGGEEGGGGEGHHLAVGKRLARGLVLERVELGADRVADGADRAGDLVCAGGCIEDRGVERVVTPGGAVPEGVLGGQVVGLGRHRLVAVQGRVPFGHLPVAVGFGRLGGGGVVRVLGVLVDVAGLAGDAGHVAVDVGGGVTGCGALGRVAGARGAVHLDGAVLGPEVGTAAGDAVPGEGVAPLALDVAAVAHRHVGVVNDVGGGAGGKGDVAALHGVAAARFRVAAEAVLAGRLLARFLDHEVHVETGGRLEEAGGGVTHAAVGSVGGVGMAHEAVDGGKLRGTRVGGRDRFRAGTRVAGAAGAPVALNVDAVGVQCGGAVGSVDLALGGRAGGHFSRGALPLVMHALVHRLGLA